MTHTSLKKVSAKFLDLIYNMPINESEVTLWREYIVTYTEEIYDGACTLSLLRCITSVAHIITDEAWTHTITNKILIFKNWKKIPLKNIQSIRDRQKELATAFTS